MADARRQQRAEQMVRQCSGPNNNTAAGSAKAVEEIEMKRQLWLKSCRGDENHQKTYGSAFVAPCPNPKTLLPRKSSSKLFGHTSEDTQNLLDDMI